jgi:hypothetical protein
MREHQDIKIGKVVAANNDRATFGNVVSALPIAFCNRTQNRNYYEGTNSKSWVYAKGLAFWWVI